MTLNHFERIGCLEKLAKRREYAYLRHRLQMLLSERQRLVSGSDPTVGGGIRCC
jgi:hypothetical protein